MTAIALVNLVDMCVNAFTGGYFSLNLCVAHQAKLILGSCKGSMAACALRFKLRVRGKSTQADTRKLLGAHLAWAEQHVTTAPHQKRQSRQQDYGEKETGQ
jgi:hypothetical protein